MSKPSLEPQSLTRTAWYYEDRRGLEVVVELRETDDPFGARVVRVPWPKIMASWKRCRPIKPRRRARRKKTK